MPPKSRPQKKIAPALIKNLLNKTAESIIPSVENAVSTSNALETSSSQAMLKQNAEIDLACKISNTLVLFGWILDEHDPIRSVKLGGVATELSSRVHRYYREDISDKIDSNQAHDYGFLLLIDMPKFSTSGKLEIQTLKSNYSLPFSLTQELKENRIFNEYLGELLEVSKNQDVTDVYTLLKKFAIPVVKKKSTIVSAVDYCFMTPKGMFVSGWVFSDESEISSMVATINGKTYELYTNAHKIPREDLKKGHPNLGNRALRAGFLNFLKVDNPGCSVEPFRIKITSATDETLILEVTPREVDDRQAFSKVLLSYVDITKAGFKKLFDDYVGEALQSGLAVKEQFTFDLKVMDYGVVTTNPEVTVIIPLYGRIDFIKYQLSQFADDPDFKKNIDLIFVLDDPRFEGVFYKYCAEHAPIFDIPFRAVSYGVNLGYAGANNIAAKLAKASTFVLLNSDIMPESSGWVSALLNEYSRLEKPGALAPKLLYEDGAIQHAGMTFERSHEVEGMWANEHPGKGLPDWSGEVESKKVPAVTGACLMVSKSLYEQVGGLDEQYFLGDFEDSDLCLKLIDLGLNNYYLPSLSLYHLERQSQSLFENNDWKTKVTIYNCWQHTKRWDQSISKLIGEA